MSDNMEKIDYRSKVEKAISDFRAKKKKDEESRNAEEALKKNQRNKDANESALNSVVKETPKEKDIGQGALMDEFDQFVLHDNMQKELKDLIGMEQSSRNIDCEIIDHPEKDDMTTKEADGSKQMSNEDAVECAGNGYEKISKEGDEVGTDEEETDIEKDVGEEL